MDKPLEQHCREAFSEKGRLPAMEAILGLIRDDRRLAEELSLLADFPLLALQIITDSFYALNTEQFTRERSELVRVLVDILQILMAVPGFHRYALGARLDFYICPFILSEADDRVKLSALRFLSAMLADGMPPTVRGSEIIPLLLKVAGDGSDDAQVLALDVLHRALHGTGLDYAVQTVDRFQAIDVVLNGLLNKASSTMNGALLRNLFKIYLRLCTKPNVRERLREKLPMGLEARGVQEVCRAHEDLRDARRELLGMVERGGK